MSTIVRHVHEAPAVAGVERVLLPGEREWARHRAAESAGIPLPADVREKLAAAAALVGLQPPA
jgi:LDH2 family malate/lactate/ureidoglycolate dehydrogenase